MAGAEMSGVDAAAGSLVSARSRARTVSTPAGSIGCSREFGLVRSSSAPGSASGTPCPGSPATTRQGSAADV
ncbi:hypothetical protein [Actinosynnema mirum]|uniref:hypothetical protein n=1 Tax=Actinosynnema mirum TaxID=40567 RepID=UPI00019ABAAA|nr:hypothetical protein [Actinosynnema mirum]